MRKTVRRKTKEKPLLEQITHQKEQKKNTKGKNLQATVKRSKNLNCTDCVANHLPDDGKADGWWWFRGELAKIKTELQHRFIT